MIPQFRSVPRVWVVAASMVVSATVSGQDVVDRQQLLEELSGTADQVATTRSIVPEVVYSPAYKARSLPAIQFDYDSAQLTQAAERQLRELGAALHMEPLNRSRFAIQGHTDSTGEAAYNRALSQGRARSVTNFLSDVSGIPAERLTAVGVGESLPLQGVPEDDAQNRRVEVISLGARASVVAGDGGSAATEGDSRALLIGIDQYTSVSSLNGAPINDVRAVRQFVEQQLGYETAQIRMLLNEDATRDNVIRSIRDWLLQGDHAFFYFSGHGFQQRDTDNDEADGWDETLVPYDVVVENNIVSGMILDDEIDQLLATAHAVSVDVLIDSCHSGTLTRSVDAGTDWGFVKSPRLPDGTPLALRAATRSFNMETSRELVGSTHPGVTVWTAVRADQKALVDSSSGPRYMSVFTRRLLSGLGGAADFDANGVVTSRELHRHVSRESDVYCKATPGYCAGGLTPELSISRSSIDSPAFALEFSKSPPIVSLAKDILVSSSVGDGEIAEAVRLDIYPGARLRVGEEIEVTVDSDLGGGLVLLDIDAQGQVTQIFPNEWTDSRLIAEDTLVRIPSETASFRFRAQPPLGRGVLIAVVAQDEFRLESLTGLHKDLSVIPRPEAYLVELAGHLRNRNVGWGYAERAYEVVSN